MDPQELGRIVLKRRKELGLSQGALADKADISRNYVSLIERGEAHNVSTNILSQLATALGTTPAELMGQSEQVDVLIPPALREFALEKGLSFEIVDTLSHISRRGRGRELRTVAEWRELYEALRPYLTQAD